MSNEQDNQAGAAGSVEQVIRADGRYRLEAFNFLHEALALAVKEAHGAQAGRSDRDSHVSGQRLCRSIQDLARQRYGLMAGAIFRHWGIHSSLDFGKMVYLLIDHGFMRRTAEDSLDDFRDVFDLGDLERDYAIGLKEDQ